MREPEWEEVYSILVQAQKGALFNVWRTEETLKGIHLSPKVFWIALREPDEGEWPPDPPQNGVWVDPEKVELTDLPDPTTGREARRIWKERFERLEEIYNDLEQVRKDHHADGDNGFMAIVRHAIGDPGPEPGPPGDPPHNLDQLIVELGSEDEATVSNAVSKIENGLFMPVEAFEELMRIKLRADAAELENKPEMSDWGKCRRNPDFCSETKA